MTHLSYTQHALHTSCKWIATGVVALVCGNALAADASRGVEQLLAARNRTNAA